MKKHFVPEDVVKQALETREKERKFYEKQVNDEVSKESEPVFTLQEVQAIISLREKGVRFLW